MPIYALVDANSFYASCEIAFNPKLENRPVVVLSNNDGCIVAANQIAKDLAKRFPIHYGSGGYQAAKPSSMMFQPYFKVEKMLKRFDTAVFSSNYELYGDMSSRMHRLLGEFASAQEIYSIDESFLDLSGMQKWNLTDYGHRIQQTIKQGLGLPVAVGIATSKTLAKLANHLAKKHQGYQGVLDLTALSEPVVNHLLRQVSVGDVWGIGKKLALQLNEMKIETALDLKYSNLKSLRKRFSVVMERLVLELNGQACLSLEESTPTKQQILTSRSFGQPVTDFESLAQAVASYTARAAQKLRAQDGLCQYISVFIRTNPFQVAKPFYQNQHTYGLVYPTNHTGLLLTMAKRALNRIWQPGLAYHKAGVCLSDIHPKGAMQLDVFAPNPRFSANPKSDALMKVVDQVNQQMGRGTMQFAAEGLRAKKPWQMRRDLCSPRYTTRIDEVLTVW
ncbi:Y-family DNA polymerase [Thiomicrospira microaerophila]|uniref:Y-family DNA polymerase n=1 Tax=Thiomicrospira microaerophila TaxID=406020 RepID=UPI00200FE1BB|nr:Y-family DNA polymerase [Thiomicrospira microaerophila]UQB41621.1 Y-family DNA polymerase [Thiomicrospira microaerophila]